MEAIKEIVPSATQIAVIFNPETAPFYGLFLPFIETAARRAGIKTNVTPIHDPADIAGTIDKLAKESNRPNCPPRRSVYRHQKRNYYNRRAATPASRLPV